MPRIEQSSGWRGFILPVVLGILFVAALLALHAASESSLAATLSSARVLQQRAFEASDRGLSTVAALLDQAAEDPPATQILAMPGHPTDLAEVQFRRSGSHELPSGYSAGRFVEQQFELRSTGRSLRNATSTQSLGLRRLEWRAP